MHHECTFLRSIVHQTSVPTFVLSPEHRVLIWNRACEELTGRTAEEMLGTDQSWKAFYSEQRPVLADLVINGESTRGHYAETDAGPLTPEGLQAEGWYRDLNGSERYLVFRAVPIRDDAGMLLAVVETMEDLTQRKRYEELLAYQANHDLLTGLPNRNLLTDRIRQALLTAPRERQEVALFLLDLDNFKLINDTLGHEGGDLVLKEVAARLGGCLRAGDTVARHGGDEFIVVISSDALFDRASHVAGKVLETVAQPIPVGDRVLTVTASIGISIAPRDGDDVNALLKNAEAAMYRAKEAGANSFRFYTSEMNSRSLARMTLEQQLRRALERDDEISVFYQPKVHFRSGAITGLEALVRWNSPELGMVTPDAFIHLAEETGLILPLGARVLASACRQVKAWQERGCPPLQVAVNLSPRQFQAENVCTLVDEVLRETGLAPQFLELEITESTLMHDVERVAEVLAELKGAGISLSLDDFGTGYSSLSYLQRFPFDKLKIDQSFVRDITSNPGNAAIAKTIIAMAHTLHLKVVAEGVETEGQFNYLRRHGCDEAQGYYLSRPLPEAELEPLLRQPLALTLAETAAATAKTVLVLDDEESVVRSLKRVLRLEGYSVLTATNPQDAFDLLSLHAVAVVVSDFRMPGMNGVEFLRRVREIHPEVTRVMISACADLQTVTDAVNMGAIAKFLIKPWRDKDVVDSIGEAFRQHGAPPVG